MYLVESIALWCIASIPLAVVIALFRLRMTVDTDKVSLLKR